VSDQARVVVADTVFDRDYQLRWVVAAVFIGVAGSEPRCIDYRVRVVPPMPTTITQVAAANRIIDELHADMTGRERPEVWDAAENDPPAQGIPRYVFERASQAALLVKARRKVKARPASVQRSVRELLERSRTPRAGRPPAVPLREKLAMLATAEQAFADPEIRSVREHVGKLYGRSPEAVRDLLSWARHQEPPLFTSPGGGRRGGELTEVARALLAEGE
jgi:hypothetical protein